MSWGGALYRLLRRPAVLAWIPLAGFASVSAMLAVAMVWLWVDFSLPGAARIVANLAFGDGAPMSVLVLAFSTMTGMFVGQAIKELQHCHFSWALPELRRRLLPGALLVGLIVAVFAREILSGVALLALAILQADPMRYLLAFWEAFPPASVGLAALAFMAFWIGIRPSLANCVGVMAPLLVSIPLLENAIIAHPLVTVMATAPLTAFLIHETFSVGSARARPFIATKTLTGGGQRASTRTRRRGAPARDAAWRINYLGDQLINWLRAGAYENHGFRPATVRIASILVAAVATSYLGWRVLDVWWTTPGASYWNLYGRALPGRGGYPSLSSLVSTNSTFIAVSLAVLLACYASISLSRRSLYPLARRQLARIEFWGSVAETLIICGLMIAVLIVFWTFMPLAEPGAWRRELGGPYGWMALLLRPLATVFMLTPIAQLFRLRYIRGPVRWSMVRERISVIALVLILTYVGGSIVVLSYYVLPATSLLGDVLLFGAVGLLFQSAYQRLVEWHFATADLV